MQTNDIALLIVFLLALGLSAPALGAWMAKVFSGEPHLLSRMLGRVERLILRSAGVDPGRGMGWKTYLSAILVFNLAGFVVLMALQLLQHRLPANPQGLPAVPPWLAFNTAVSFVTNTNWQAYSGEATLSNLTQMLGLGVQNFLSAATGIAVFLALVRGLRGRPGDHLGNAWVDLVRATLHVLLPLSIVLAVALVSQGVVQSFADFPEASTLEGAKQVVPLGPAASQIAIKQLGTNGGGFFGVNSAHPFENPTPLSNFLELLAILLLPAALPFTFGRMTGRPRDGRVLFGVMAALFLGATALSITAEHGLGAAGLEGKELRFGPAATALWGAATTAASNGSVNGMHDSMAPLSGAAQLFQMMTGEVIFGGVGSGMYGMLLYALLAVFLAGLMVGRTPEYLGKRIDAPMLAWAVAGLLLPSAAILAGTALSCALPAGAGAVSNAGPHGFSQILYAWTSAGANNGSAFGGLGAGADFYCIGLGVAMLVGRYGVIVPVLLLAGRALRCRSVPPSGGTFPTGGLLFGVLLLSVIVIVGGLTFLPALFLGPVAEHLLLSAGRLF
ncbi:MAG: potassium-transporting ATPase subunit KdpA [Kiritimatiellia bacterium]